VSYLSKVAIFLTPRVFGAHIRVIPLASENYSVPEKNSHFVF